MLQKFVISAPRPARYNLQNQKKGYNFTVSFLFLSSLLFMTLTPRKKRFLIALPLAILSGFACATMLATQVPVLWGTALMWIILADRLVLGVMVGLVGAFTHHPVFDFRMPVCFRGCCMGVFASLPLSAGFALAPEVPSMFVWLVIVASGVLGGVIDWLATRFGGDGKAIME